MYQTLEKLKTEQSVLKNKIADIKAYLEKQNSLESFDEEFWVLSEQYQHMKIYESTLKRLIDLREKECYESRQYECDSDGRSR